MPLINYIAAQFGGNQSEFARHVGVNRQQVTRWINEGFIVVDETLYSPRRKINNQTT